MLRTAALATLCASAAAFSSPAVFSNTAAKVWLMFLEISILWRDDLVVFLKTNKKFFQQARSGLSLRMSTEEVSRRGVIEGATVIGAAALVAPQLASAKVETKQAKDFLAPATYSKFYNGKAPNTAPIVSSPKSLNLSPENSRENRLGLMFVLCMLILRISGCYSRRARLPPPPQRIHWPEVWH
jgi:hypothetical protein